VCVCFCICCCVCMCVRLHLCHRVRRGGQGSHASHFAPETRASLDLHRVFSPGAVPFFISLSLSFVLSLSLSLSRAHPHSVSSASCCACQAQLGRLPPSVRPADPVRHTCIQTNELLYAFFFGCTSLLPPTPTRILMHAAAREPLVSPLCEVTGGKLYVVTNQKVCVCVCVCVCV
jgi:hypothetical protein